MASLLLMPLTVLAVPSEEELVTAKDSFTQLWHSAAETTKRRDDLEQHLAQYDVKVKQAQHDLSEAVQSRLDIRERIADRRKLVDLLTEQIHAAAESEGFYRAVVASERDDYTAFIRFVASKDIAAEQSGPSAGGALLKHLLRGSLGESVDDELARSALINARSHFFQQIQTLLSESDHAEQRLTLIADQLTSELDALEGQSKTLGSVVDRQAAVIDMSWRQKKLTEAEIKSVEQESAEAMTRLSSMQESLLTINAKLKDEKLTQLRGEFSEIEKSKNAVEQERDALKRKDDAMRMLEDSAMKALQNAMQMKNTDKKVYKRLEETKLKLANDDEAMKAIVPDGSGALTPEALKQRQSLEQEMSVLKEVIVLLEQGVPLDAAQECVRTKHEAQDATAERATIAAQMPALTTKILSFSSALSAKAAEIDATERETGLDGLPPMFSWPVTGPITAGYLDPDYERVFSIPHRAIDIGVPQGTPVHAIADGIVFAVKDGGATGYSYILIGHRNGYASLYGHVSVAMVQKGDTVRFGQTIALSGGQPGTHGAGHMTTGAHLHLEMTKDGAHFDPRTVLPKR